MGTMTSTPVHVSPRRERSVVGQLVQGWGALYSLPRLVPACAIALAPLHHWTFFLVGQLACTARWRRCPMGTMTSSPVHVSPRRARSVVGQLVQGWGALYSLPRLVPACAITLAPLYHWTFFSCRTTGVYSTVASLPYGHDDIKSGSRVTSTGTLRGGPVGAGLRCAIQLASPGASLRHYARPIVSLNLFFL